jgi:ribonuclease HI
MLVGVALTVGDVMLWDCEMARELWTVAMANWHSLCGTHQILGKSDIFSAQLQDVPIGLTRTITTATAADPRMTPVETGDQVHAFLSLAWRLCVFATIHAIWRHRLNTLYPPEFQWNIEFAKGALRRRLREGYAMLENANSVADNTYSVIRAARIAVAGLTADRGDILPRPIVSTQPRYTIFFDGGSRGNPGAGGSGSVICRMTQDRGLDEVEWVACTSLAHPTTTNNIAEFFGLQMALATAKLLGLRNVHVVGDSMMIINMMQQRRQPLSKRLRQIYLRCRRLADVCEIVTWTHHYRRYNKAADQLANIAMDTRESRQTTHPTQTCMERRFPGVLNHLTTDLAHRWTDGPDADTAATWNSNKCTIAP